jgi:GMP synthase-like glutamine amidotransferase
MTTRIAVLQHEPETGLGRFAAQLDDARVEYEVFSPRAPLPEPLTFTAALGLGGSLAANDASLRPTRRWIRNAVLGGLPYLGVCLGGQLLARALGGRVRRGGAETGVDSVFLTPAARDDHLFGGLPHRLDVFGWHGDCFELPRSAVRLAGSLACRSQAFRFGAAAYGLQFHPEVRPEDIARWRDRPGYRRLLEQSGRSWGDVVSELRHAEGALDELAAHLLERWLDLAAGGPTLRHSLDDHDLRVKRRLRDRHERELATRYGAPTAA